MSLNSDPADSTSLPPGETGRDRHRLEKEWADEDRREACRKAERRQAQRRREALDAFRSAIGGIDIFDEAVQLVPPADVDYEAIPTPQLQRRLRIFRHAIPHIDGRLTTWAEGIRDGMEHERNRRIQVVLLVEQTERERKRAERIAAHKPKAGITRERRCIVCERKPARINDYCKKCARAQGIIVHGKIGES